MKSYFKTAVLILCSLLALTGCAPDRALEDEPTPSLPPVKVVTPTPEPTVEPTEEPEYTGPRNPLSGLPIAEEKVNLRPLAIMINNKKVAQPQLGVGEADIIVEVPVEGSITRMLAIYQDTSNVGEIGSIRSSRPYYIDIAQGFDAIYIHAGGSPDAYKTLSSRKVPRFDGVNGPGPKMFYRDASRRRSMGYEHSMLTSGDKIKENIESLNYRLEHEDDYKNPLAFEDDLTITGEIAETINIAFSSSKSTSFTLDDENSLYKAFQYGKEYADGNTGECLTFSNVIILKTSISVIRGDTEGRLSVDMKGGGEGYLAIGGKCMPIKWSKNSPAEPFVFTDSDGNPVTLRSGHTYIAVVSNSAKTEFAENTD